MYNKIGLHDLVYVQQKEHVDSLGKTYLWAIASTPVC
jgi:hypothetical protein